jgi:hypothetical protein
MNCPACQRPNRDERRYCGECGHSLVRRCDRCEFANTHEDKFCGGCGLGMGLLETAAFAKTASAIKPELLDAGAALQEKGPRKLGLEELQGLLPTAAGTQVPPRVPLRVSQDDLDVLFGANG